MSLQLEELPVEYREVVILRELEGMSYKEIAVIADIPIGTVMSRLARARRRLRQYLTNRPDKQVSAAASAPNALAHPDFTSGTHLLRPCRLTPNVPDASICVIPESSAFSTR
jgi:RNA polymerase sigma-70 factor, ECF subfamily